MNCSIENKGVLQTIESFTMPISKKSRAERKKFNKIVESDRTYIYRDKDFQLEFSKLSDYVDDDILVQELQSVSRRYNNCYKNLSIAKIFDNSTVVVGFVTVDDKTFLHSWIEFSFNNRKTVADYTRNVVMDADIYYYFMSAENILNFSVENYSKYIDVFKDSEELDNTVCCSIDDDKIDYIRKQLVLSGNK